MNAHHLLGIEFRKAVCCGNPSFVETELRLISGPGAGYVLGIVIEAIIQFQAGTDQPDPIHLTAHFMKPTSPGRCEVRIRVLRTGKGFRNLTATVVQNVSWLLSTCHMVV